MTLRHEQHYGIEDVHDLYEKPRRGKVYLIGAGPGDPELMTIKGLRCLREADVVLYDRLISPLLLEETRPGAALMYVGKGPKNHSLPQEDINTLLITYARQGCTVARLKGGDPYIFGRGGEEAEVLAEASVPFEVVPGVSSAVAVPAYAGIPVTHRDHASSVTFVTGHEYHNREQTVNWEALAALGGTLVVLMGVTALPNFTRRLIAGGLAADTPAAIIQEGTTENQRIITGTVENIARLARESGLTSPALTVIGSVVNLSETLRNANALLCQQEAS